MTFKGYSLKGVLGALAIGAAIMLGGNEKAYAQDHHQRYERQDLRQHQRLERYNYGNSRALRGHQRREHYQLERHQRFERRRDYYGYGRGWRRHRGW
jgi:hypothetical protein